MARLTAEDEGCIEALIQDWRNPKLSWDMLVAACKSELGIETTRQALNTRERIKALMKLRKTELKAPSQAPGYIKDLQAANKRIEALTKRVGELEYANNQLIDMFIRWQYNASLYGVSEEKLNQPVPPGG
ncbi:MAG: hypothetical protein CL693_12095 [Cellvibrionaceae bacterium]|nr:hypothetical protein [Cellvibrionaceae bacterium]|tara:strand:- start:222 stop:611 length:390 start_codon:yes stop_codon:yes gene_type:complete